MSVVVFFAIGACIAGLAIGVVTTLVGCVAAIMYPWHRKRLMMREWRLRFPIVRSAPLPRARLVRSK